MFTCRFVFWESRTLVLWASLCVWVLMEHGFFVTRAGSPPCLSAETSAVCKPTTEHLPVQAAWGLSWPQHLTLWLLWTRTISSCFLMFEKSGMPLDWNDSSRHIRVIVKVTQLCPTLCDPMDCGPWNPPGQNEVGSPSLLQGIFPTQGSNPDLLHCRWNLYQLSHLIA